MAYAPSDRDYYDADSHIMELPDFLTSYADPDLRDQIPEVSYSASIVTDEEVAVIVAQGGRHSAEHVDAQIGLGDRLIESSKEIQALGAFTASDRSTALDLLGFKKQLVFATHSVRLPFHPSSSTESRLRYGAARAHNRHMDEFCADDDRLMGVGIVPLDDPEHAIAELDRMLETGLESVWVPHRAPIDRSPGHVDFDPFWSRLAEAGVPFLVHVGGAPLQVSGAWTNNGRGQASDWIGGGENVRTKDAALLHHPVETFMSVLVLDGVLERHPQLRGAAVELGAGWVPAMLNRLDSISRFYGRVDEAVRFDRLPSEQITAQLGFTPMPHEDVAALVASSNEQLYLFSSDYPHIEGTRDPIARFERTMADADATLRDAFYSENFLRLWPEARVQSTSA